MTERAGRKRRPPMPRVFWYLWAGTLLNRLGTFVLPFLTLFLTAQRALSPSVAALMLGLYGGGAFVSSLVGGWAADHYGRRAVLLMSLVGGAAAMLVVPAVGGVVPLGVAVTVLGFFTELYRPAVSAAVADLVPDEQRTRAFALLYWAINIGAAIAPVLAGLLAARSYTALFVVDAVTMLGYAVVVALRVPETRPPPDAAAPATPAWSRWRTALRDPALMALAVIWLGVGGLFFQAVSTLPLAMRADGLSEADFGLAVAANGALVVLISLPVADVVSRFRPALMLAVGSALVGAGFGLTGWADTFGAHVGAIAVWTLGEVIVVPVAPALVARLSPAAQRGVYQGVYAASAGLSHAIGPVVGGAVFEFAGEGALWGGCLAVGLAAAAGFLALMFRTARPPTPTEALETTGALKGSGVYEQEQRLRDL